MGGTGQGKCQAQEAQVYQLKSLKSRILKTSKANLCDSDSASIRPEVMQGCKRVRGGGREGGWKGDARDSVASMIGWFDTYLQSVSGESTGAKGQSHSRGAQQVRSVFRDEAQAALQIVTGCNGSCPGQHGCADVTPDCHPFQVKIWEEKAKAMVEERSKVRSALETELRTLKAYQDELASKFDESLLTLQSVCTHTHLHSPAYTKSGNLYNP